MTIDSKKNKMIDKNIIIYKKRLNKKGQGAIELTTPQIIAIVLGALLLLVALLFYKQIIGYFNNFLS